MKLIGSVLILLGILSISATGEPPVHRHQISHHYNDEFEEQKPYFQGIRGLFSRFLASLRAPEIPGETTEEVLKPIIKETHHHEWIKKPYYREEIIESQGKPQKQRIVHHHYKHQKVVHKNNHHKHVEHEHTLHNVHTHNLHNQINHIHKHVKEIEHVHKPIHHEYEHHQHKVTQQQVTKYTENNQIQHQKGQNQETHVHAAPIYEKEWSFWKWLRTMTSNW